MVALGWKTCDAKSSMATMLPLSPPPSTRGLGIASTGVTKSTLAGLGADLHGANGESRLEQTCTGLMVRADWSSVMCRVSEVPEVIGEQRADDLAR